MFIHIGEICSKAFYGLYEVRQKFLNPESTRSFGHAFVTSHLVYCNSFLFGVPKYQIDPLQKVLNAAARLIFRIPKFDHISPTLLWKAITFLCGHSLLHDVVSPLCDVVLSLCDVVSPLRDVVSS